VNWANAQVECAGSPAWGLPKDLLFAGDAPLEKRRTLTCHAISMKFDESGMTLTVWIPSALRHRPVKWP
jgi:hypothetical protein